MPVSDLCSRDLVCVEKSADFQKAAQIMKQNQIGGLVVVDSYSSSMPVGILTDRDIVLSAVAENLSNGTKVQEIMTKNIVTVDKSEGIASAVDKMERTGVRRMVVVDQEGNACGLVSTDDIIQLVARELSGLGKLVARQGRIEKARNFQQAKAAVQH